MFSQERRPGFNFAGEVQRNTIHLMITPYPGGFERMTFVGMRPAGLRWVGAGCWLNNNNNNTEK